METEQTITVTFTRAELEAVLNGLLWGVRLTKAYGAGEHADRPHIRGAMLKVIEGGRRVA